MIFVDFLQAFNRACKLVRIHSIGLSCYAKYFQSLENIQLLFELLLDILAFQNLILLILPEVYCFCCLLFFALAGLKSEQRDN